MCSQAKLERRLQRRVHNRIWRKEVLKEIIPGEPEADVFVGDSIAEEDIVLPAGSLAYAFGSSELDPEILQLAGMSVEEDGLPVGLHIMTRRELRKPNLGYAA